MSSDEYENFGVSLGEGMNIIEDTHHPPYQNLSKVKRTQTVEVERSKSKSGSPRITATASGNRSATATTASASATPSLNRNENVIRRPLPKFIRVDNSNSRIGSPTPSIFSAPNTSARQREANKNKVVSSPSAARPQTVPQAKSNANSKSPPPPAPVEFSTNQPWGAQLMECKTDTSFLLLVKSQLRAHQTYGIGDPRLYSSLSDAARYVQTMCANDVNRQDAVRTSGVLASLVDVFVHFYEGHLQGHVDPLTHSQLINCWSQICSALYEAVEKPINHRNQNFVLGKFIEKNDLKFIEFVLSTSNSIDKQSESYVIPIIQLTKALVADNKNLQELISSRSYFLSALAEGLKIRLQLTIYDPLMWKSIDLMALLLSMLIPVNKDVSVSLSQNSDKLTFLEDFIPGESGQKKIVRLLAEMISPGLQYIEKDRLAERTPSVGLVMLFASIISRDLELVQRFISAGGEITLSQIFSNSPPSGLIDATKLAFQTLTVQKKQMRQRGLDLENINIGGSDGRSFSSQQSTPVFQQFPQGSQGHQIQTNSTTRPTTALSRCGGGSQFQIPNVNSSSSNVNLTQSRNTSDKNCSYVEAWINSSANAAAANKDSKMSSESSGSPAVPPPPPASVTESSVSQYKAPSVLSMPHPRFLEPMSRHGCGAGGPSPCMGYPMSMPMSHPQMHGNRSGTGAHYHSHSTYSCCGGMGLVPSTSSNFHNGYGSSSSVSVCGSTNPKKRRLSLPTETKTKKVGKSESESLNRARARTCTGQEKEKMENSDDDDGDDNEFDRESMISINIPRKKPAANSDGSPVQDQSDFPGEKFSKILDNFELRPREILETENHFVVYCSPQKKPAEKKPSSEIPISTEQENRKRKNPSTSKPGIIGSIINWLIH